MIPIRIASILLVAALARTAAGQGLAADSLPPGTTLRVELRPAEDAASLRTLYGVSANPIVGRNGGVFKGRFDAWDADGLHITEPASGMSWTFPRSALVAVDARTGSDRSRKALFRGALAGAVVGALGAYFFTSTTYHTFNPFAYGAQSNDVSSGAATGFVVGAAIRYLYPPGIWRRVRLTAPGS